MNSKAFHFDEDTLTVVDGELRSGLFFQDWVAPIEVESYSKSGQNEGRRVGEQVDEETASQDKCHELHENADKVSEGIEIRRDVGLLNCVGITELVRHEVCGNRVRKENQKIESQFEERKSLRSVDNVLEERCDGKAEGEHDEGDEPIGDLIELHELADLLVLFAFDWPVESEGHGRAEAELSKREETEDLRVKSVDAEIVFAKDMYEDGPGYEAGEKAYTLPDESVN